MKTIAKHIIGLTVMTGIVTFSGCNSFLDEMPSKSTSLPITTIEQLDALLSKYTDFCDESNKAAHTAHDDYEFPIELYDAVPLFFSRPNQVLQSYLWDYENFSRSNRDDFWGGDGNKMGEYGKIFRANVVLSNIDKVAGSAEDKARLKAEAYFIRAYSHWSLANTYCLPYTEQTKNEPGIPLKKSNSYEETAQRATLEETYAFIESDLNEALKCQTPLIKDGVAKRWRANTAGINGFAARFYLNRNNYQKALDYANKALNEWNVLVDYNTEMSESDSYGFGVNFPSTFDPDASNYTKKLAWKESLYMRFLYTTYVDMLYFPSRDLTALYDTQHDLRYKYHFVEGFMEIYGSKYSYPVYMFFSFNHIPSGPTTAEMYLIKAECQVRLGDYNSGMQTVNQLRAKRLTPGSWVNLQAVSQKDALKSIIDERRRELPFSQRWNDLRRYNNNEDPDDDVQSIIRKFYPISSSAIYDKDAPIIYKLEKNSRKYAFPINQNEITVSGGVIKQNTY